MSYWETQEGINTGIAIQNLVSKVEELVNITNNKKDIKYNTPMKIKTFILDNTFSAALSKQDDEVNEFIKDKHVIDMKITRTDESHIRLMVEYKEVTPSTE